MTTTELTLERNTGRARRGARVRIRHGKTALQTINPKNDVLRLQCIWTAISVLATGCLYFALKHYTSAIDRPDLMLYSLLFTHAFRVYLNVKDDRHQETMKEVGLLTLAALGGVAIASVVRPMVLWMLNDLEQTQEIVFVQYKQYLDVMHSPVFGIAAFFGAGYFLSSKVLRRVGKYWRPIAYPRSSYELFGAHYEASLRILTESVKDEVEERAKVILAGTEGLYQPPSPNSLIGPPASSPTSASSVQMQVS